MTPAFQGELQLASWSESANGGAKVVFWLADADDLDVFKAMTVRKGNRAGQRFAAVLVEIGDDERPVEPQGEVAAAADAQLARLAGDTTAKADLKGGALAKLAGRWCQSPEFREWADVADADEAAEYIRAMCGVESRAELDHNPEAAAAFHKYIRQPYADWLQLVKGV
jgi:hypothetical protein